MIQTEEQINLLLKPFQRFGISLGLTRIEKLLNDLGNPQKKVPIIHVAGTNGKGSVCAYLSSILTAAGYKTGRFISPHLISWTERICLNQKPIAGDNLITILRHIQDNIDPHGESPTQFEVITAAAWLYFAQSEVDVAVMEVGLGGRLDATNVCDRPLASIITSISREHWQRLGDTLAKIAYEKAGVIKANCPVVVGKLPSEAQQVIQAKTAKLNCPTVWVESAQKITNQDEDWATYQGFSYPLSLKGEIQLQNSALAIATVHILQQQGWSISQSAIEQGMRATRWAGRIEWVRWHNQDILIDGAHNVASAKILREYVNSLNRPIIWVMGMLSTKDHQGILESLLYPDDQLYLVPVPDHSTANPEELAKLAQEIFPQLPTPKIEQELFLALDKALKMVKNQQKTVVICGSLYLLGYFLKQYQTRT